jgi:outer membrane autotransporter protein
MGHDDGTRRDRGMLRCPLPARLVLTAAGQTILGRIGPIIVAAVASLLAAMSFAAAAPGDWTLTKTANPTTYSAAGQVITYTYVIKSHIGAPGTLATLTDTKVAAVNCPTHNIPANGTLTCTGSYTTTAADVTAGSVTNVATATGDSCNDGCNTTATATATITLVATRTSVPPQQAGSLINQFMVYRLNLLIQDDPDRVQFLRRIPGALWGDPGVGGSTSGTPLNFAGSSDDLSTQMSFSTSLTRIASAHDAVEKSAGASDAMAYAGGGLPFKAPPKPSVKPDSPFDVWIEGRFSQFKAQAADTSSSGSFGIVYAGADYMLTQALLVGVLVQYDFTRDRSQQLLLPASTIEGQGTMAGPYVSGRLSPNLFFDARVAWGLTDNRVSPLGAFQDSFGGNRWLAHGNLVGNWVFGNVRVTPSAGVTYISERQSGYIDTFGNAIASQTVSLGRMSVGPEFAYRFLGADGLLYEPQFSVKGVWDFQRPGVQVLGGVPVLGGAPVVGGLVVGTDALRARTELALLAKAANGFSLRGAVAYDGVGSSSFHDVSGRLWLNFPLH